MLDCVLSASIHQQSKGHHGLKCQLGIVHRKCIIWIDRDRKDLRRDANKETGREYSLQRQMCLRACRCIDRCCGYLVAKAFEIELQNSDS